MTHVQSLPVNAGDRRNRTCVRCGTPFTTYPSSKQAYCSPSCGARVSKNRKHGLSVSSEHDAWRDMKTRCYNTKNKSYPRYGGRGITVCERWQSFENFFADMGPKPGKGYSIERLDNDGNYEPSNCCWATRLDQSRNRSNVYTPEHDAIILDGKARGLTFPEIGKLLGKSGKAVATRLYRMGTSRGSAQP